MGEDILTLINAKSASFSKGQLRIAKYITESYDKAAFMTASKLGTIANVSESTVVRFATELGFAGYPEMQKAMQDMVLNRLTSVQRMEFASDRMADRDVVSMVLHADAEKLRRTDEVLDRKDFSDAVKRIQSAKRIYILGVRSASALANFLGYYLNYIFNNVHIITTSSASEIIENLVNINADDVVIAFSFPRYSTSTVKGVEFCRKAGAAVVGLTDSKLSPLGQCSDYALIAKSDMVSLVDSLVAPLSVINALIVALATGRENEIAKTFDTLENVWEEYNVYEKRIENK